MSRRNSRSNPIEYDPLEEFEAFKRKYLLINKHITKMNSGLNLKIEELNTQLSCLYVENLRLRTLNVSLSVQLKQERDKSRKIISEAETAASHLTKHISAIRHSFGVTNSSIASGEREQNHARRPTTPPPPRISRAPVFNQIHEVPSSEEDDRASALANGRPHSSLSSNSRLPRPVAESHPSESPHWTKKLSRRQSGFLEAVPRPPSPSPGSPIAAQLNALTNVIEEDEGVDTEAEEIEAVQDLLVKPEPIPSRSERNELLNENLLVRHISQSNPKQVKDRATGIRRVGFLKDVTNGNSVDWSTISSPPPSSSSPPQSLSSLISPTPAPSTPATTPLTSPTDMKAASIASSSFETPSVPPALSVCSADEMSDDPFGQAGRERRSRSRKSVNYAEPSLKVKMRKPSPESGRRSSMSATKRKRPPLLDGETTDGEAGAEGDAETDNHGHLDNRSANTVSGAGRRRSAAISASAKPLEEGRRHSISV